MSQSQNQGQSSQYLLNFSEHFHYEVDGTKQIFNPFQDYHSTQSKFPFYIGNNTSIDILQVYVYNAGSSKTPRPPQYPNTSLINSLTHTGLF
jgi:hypothetical protein